MTNLLTIVYLTHFRESRYLLFLTENYAALRILQQDLLFHADNPPFVLFGSSFPKDREYTQVIVLAMYFHAVITSVLQTYQSFNFRSVAI